MFKRLFSFFLFSLLLYNPLLASEEEGAKANTLADPKALQAPDIEQKSYMPYPAWLVQARRQQDQKPMLSAVFTIFLDRKANGTWKLMSSKQAKEWQKQIDQNPLTGCPVKDHSLNAEVAYKPAAEFFLSRSTQATNSSIEVDVGSEKQIGQWDNGCVSFGKTGFPALFSSFEKIKEIRIKGLEPAPFSIQIPQDLYPHLLLRYHHGEMLPIPARLDTVLFDPILQRAYLTYRATALTGPPLRKLEYRMVGPDAWAKASETESREESLARGQAMRDYLDQCPAPKPCWAGEVCADPQRSVDMQALARALGIKFNSSPSQAASRGPDINSVRSKP